MVTIKVHNKLLRITLIIVFTIIITHIDKQTLIVYQL